MTVTLNGKGSFQIRVQRDKVVYYDSVRENNPHASNPWRTKAAREARRRERLLLDRLGPPELQRTFDGKQNESLGIKFLTLWSRYREDSVGSLCRYDVIDLRYRDAEGRWRKREFRVGQRSLGDTIRLALNSHKKIHHRVPGEPRILYQNLLKTAKRL